MFKKKTLKSSSMVSQYNHVSWAFIFGIIPLLYNAIEN